MDLSSLATAGLDALAEYAPTLASMIGGPLAGTAVSALEGVLGIAPTGNKQTALAAVASANPDQILALQAENNRHAEALSKAGIDLETLTVRDRESARQREMAVKDWVPGVLAAAVVLVWLGGYAATMFAHLDPSIRDLITGGLRTLDAALMLVLSYYYGSSRGADASNATVHRLAKG